MGRDATYTIKVFRVDISLLNNLTDFLLKIWKVAQAILFITFIAIEIVPTIDARTLRILEYFSETLDLSPSNAPPLEALACNVQNVERQPTNASISSPRDPE
jgi:hypothetical protein